MIANRSARTGGAPVDDDDEIRHLLAEYRTTGDRAVRNRIAMAYEPLAERCASRYAGRGESLDDLRQVAMIGLIKAIDRFDPDRGGAFDRFATPTMLGELKRHFRDHSWRVSVPRRLKDLRTPVFAALEHLTCELRRSPTPDEIAEYLDVDREHVVETIVANQLYRTSSIDAEDDGSPEVAPATGTGDAVHTPTRHVVDELETWRLLRTLDERNRKIVYLRFFEERTQSEIGQRLGIGQVQVSRLLRRAFTQLREAAGDEAPPLVDTDLTHRSGAGTGRRT